MLEGCKNYYCIAVAWACRVLIVDCDVHHGWGTQLAFYDEPRVLYFSIHRYLRDHVWPPSRNSDYDFVGGARKARGYNINVPFNKASLFAFYHYVFIAIIFRVWTLQLTEIGRSRLLRVYRYLPTNLTPNS